MGLNFPSAPIVGQVYPTPALPGVPQWTWNGTTWKTGTIDTASYQPKNEVALDADQNLAFNGGMEVSQEFATTAISSPNTAFKYTVDQWQIYAGGNGTHAFIQAGSGVPGFRNSLRLYCGTAYNMAGAGDLITLVQQFEGLRWARLGWGGASAKPVTISFWVWGAVAGTMSVGIKQSPNRSYVTPVVINAALTWEYKTVTIPGDQAGTWPTDTSSCAWLMFTFATGTSWTTAPNVWTAGNFYAHTGCSNFYAGTNNDVYVMGVSVVAGSIGPTAAQSPLMMRPYDEELRLCRRYWEVVGMTMSIMSGAYDNTAFYKTTKRISPTLALFAGGVSGATYGILSHTPLEGIRQLTNPSGAIDAAFSANARM